MKTRNGFVSNSSSSSFVVIGTATPEFIRTARGLYGGKDNLVITPELGCHQFGWENTKYKHFWDRVCFAWIQAAYMQKTRKQGGRPDWMRMLNKVLKDKLNVKHIFWNDFSIGWSSDGKYHCYIDHQSASTEGQNIDMFESENQLVDFLFGPNSYIQGGNDNE